MRSTIDKAGRLVIPKPLRDQLGLRPGDVELTADGAALRVVPVHDDTLVEFDGRLVIPASGVAIGDELVQALRAAEDRKSTRLNSSHEWISYAVFCLKKKKRNKN